MQDILRRLMRDGWLRRGDVSTLAIAFVSPLITWRQLHAIDADGYISRIERVLRRQK